MEKFIFCALHFDRFQEDEMNRTILFNTQFDLIVAGTETSRQNSSRLFFFKIFKKTKKIT